MARIRTIKPEFWTSEQIVACSIHARLLFVGIWNFSDDGGRHVASFKRIKMEVFPADPFTDAQIAEWISELIDQGLLLEYEHSGQRYWQVTGWSNQRIDRPNIRHPDPEESSIVRGSIDEYSSRARRAVSEQSPPETERNGTEPEKEKDYPDPDPARGRARSGPIPRGMEGKDWEVIQEDSVLSDASSRFLDHLPPGKLAAGAFDVILQKHLESPEQMLYWHRCALGCDKPIVGPTVAHAILTLAAARHAMKVPDRKIRKTRVAYFCNLLVQRMWRPVLSCVPEAARDVEQAMNELERKLESMEMHQGTEES